ncbi:hypothetical protein WJX81_004125 [Elliptochloris bilobata]|uniref:AP2/ERF domain-containing protein n=1 Tax=Elliptochloris bilobata TaxID=381761 RepID=A0AAW1RMZ6_9CHLO
MFRAGVPSLERLCIGTLIEYKACLGDLGDLPIDLFGAVLDECGPDDLAQIEDDTRDGGRDIACDLACHWRRCCQHEFIDAAHSRSIKVIDQASEAAGAGEVRPPGELATSLQPGAAASSAAEVLDPATAGAAGVEHRSDYRGVSWHKTSQRWRANIKFEGRKVSLGTFLDERTAARVFDSEAVRRRGPSTALNFSLDRYPAELAEWTAVSGSPATVPSCKSVRGLPQRNDYLPMDHVLMDAAVAAMTGAGGEAPPAPVTADAGGDADNLLAMQQQALAWARAKVAAGEAEHSDALADADAGLWQAPEDGEAPQLLADAAASDVSEAGLEYAGSAAGAPEAQADGAANAASPPGKRQRTGPALSSAAAAAAIAAAEIYSIHVDGAASGAAAAHSGGSGGGAEAAGQEAGEVGVDGLPRKSKYIGVSLKAPGKWIAKIKDKERKIGLGTFDSEEEAARVYDRAAIALRRTRAKTNFPHSNYAAQAGSDITQIMARRRRGCPVNLDIREPSVAPPLISMMRAPGLAEAAMAAAAAVSRLQEAMLAPGPWAQAVASAAGAPAASAPARLWLPPASQATAAGATPSSRNDC